MWHRFQLNGDAVHDLDSMHSATHKRGSSMRSGPRTSESRRILCRTRKPCGIEFQLRLCLFFWGVLCVFLQRNGVLVGQWSHRSCRSCNPVIVNIQDKTTYKATRRHGSHILHDESIQGPNEETRLQWTRRCRLPMYQLEYICVFSSVLAPNNETES